jgi:hypothetical protein
LLPHSTEKFLSTLREIRITSHKIYQSAMLCLVCRICSETSCTQIG